MTLEEKRKCLGNWCDAQAAYNDCSDCMFGESNDSWCNHYSEVNIPEDVCDQALKSIGILTEETPEETPVDIVNHPPHYTRENAMECIDEMILLFGTEAVMKFCLCNAWKYRYRSAAKNGEEDIAKSDWYIKKYKELSSR